MEIEPTDLSGSLRAALKDMADALNGRHLRYALIGGIAVAFRSRPRFTEDLDFLIEVPQMTLPGLLEDLQRRGFTFEMEKTIKGWTTEHMAELSFGEVVIDWLKPVVPLYKHVIDTAVPESLFGYSLAIASPEGLILTKLIAARSQDWVDTENLLAANRGQLDLDFIKSEWATIAAEDDPRMQRFLQLVPKFYA